METKITRWAIEASFSMAFLLLVVFLSLSIGPDGGFSSILTLPSLSGLDPLRHSILYHIRLPRILLGLAVGGSLSIAGVVLQGLFRNGLVEPYTLGISGGSAFGVCLAMTAGLSSSLGAYTLPISGFAGAAVVILFLHILSIRRGIMRIQNVLLTGVMVNFVCSSSIMLIMSLAKFEELHGIVFWIMGSLEETDWFLVRFAVILSCAGLVASYFFCFDLNALSLGEEEALHLGINTERTKKLLFLMASILTGTCVSVAGLIGFVGLVVPHFVRIFVGKDHRTLLICSFLMGAAFLILCDTIARTLSYPAELPVGVVTGIIGGSLFIYALAKRSFFAGQRR